jgi:hypothetical protein
LLIERRLFHIERGQGLSESPSHGGFPQALAKTRAASFRIPLRSASSLTPSRLQEEKSRPALPPADSSSKPSERG